MNLHEWVDADLTSLTFDATRDCISIELSSTHDGSNLAKITCTGVLVMCIQSALAPNGSQLPVVVNKVIIDLLKYEHVEQTLKAANYGFRFAGLAILPDNVDQVFRVKFEGGEIESEIIALSCDVRRA